MIRVAVPSGLTMLERYSGGSWTGNSRRVLDAIIDREKTASSSGVYSGPRAYMSSMNARSSVPAYAAMVETENWCMSVRLEKVERSNVASTAYMMAFWSSGYSRFPMNTGAAVLTASSARACGSEVRIELS